MPAIPSLIVACSRPLGDLLAWLVIMYLYTGCIGLAAPALPALGLPGFPALAALLAPLFLFSPVRLVRQLIWNTPLRARAQSKGKNLALLGADLVGVLLILFFLMWEGSESYLSSADSWTWNWFDWLTALAFGLAAFLFSPVRFIRKLHLGIPLRAKAKTTEGQLLLMVGDILCVLLFISLTMHMMIMLDGVPSWYP